MAVRGIIIILTKPQSCVCMLQLVTECKNLITHADDVYERIMQAQQAGMEWHEELQPLATQAGLKGKKLNKVWRVCLFYLTDQICGS